MIDRLARNTLAEQLRHFVAGVTDNFTFDDRVFAIHSKDTGVIAIRNEVWFVYDDLGRHKLKGRWALSVQQKKALLRCIVFLKTDNAYQWPNKPRGNLLHFLVRCLTLGLASKRPECTREASGDVASWPFLTDEAFTIAKRNPCYLAHALRHQIPAL